MASQLVNGFLVEVGVRMKWVPAGSNMRYIQRRRGSNSVSQTTQIGKNLDEMEENATLGSCRSVESSDGWQLLVRGRER